MFDVILSQPKGVVAMRRCALRASLLVTLAAGAASAAPLNLNGVNADLSFIETQAQKTVRSLTPGDFTRAGGETGTWRTVGASDWTSGFFPRGALAPLSSDGLRAMAYGCGELDRASGVPGH
jgi:hypothetical protein